MISRTPELRVSIQSLFMAMPNIFNVFLISLLFFAIFGIIGVNYLKGVYRFCYTEMIDDFDAEVLTKWDCLNVGGLWRAQTSNFDNIHNAGLTLFHMATTAGWANVMYRGLEAQSIDLVANPTQAKNPALAFFFISFMVIGSFFILNLYVGVVISTYNREKDKLGKNFLLTE